MTTRTVEEMMGTMPEGEPFPTIYTEGSLALSSSIYSLCYLAHNAADGLVRMQCLHAAAALADELRWRLEKYHRWEPGPPPPLVPGSVPSPVPGVVPAPDGRLLDATEEEGG